MAGADNVVYAPNLPLLTIKGQISIFFLDGKVIDGEFISQDRHNIFVEIEGDPLMIPRLQIRYIKGKKQQAVEPDTSALELADAPSITETQPLPTPYLPESDAPEAEKAESSTEPGLSRRPRDATVAGLGVADAQPDSEPSTPAKEAVEEEEKDDDDRTFVLPADSGQFYEEEDEDDHTYVLPPEPEPAIGATAEEEEYDDEDDDDRTFVLPAQPEPVSYAEDDDEEDSTVVIAPGEFDDEDPDDVTMVLGEMEEEEDDDMTINLSQPPQEPTAKLICTGGPHSGEVLELQSGITTMGRASDNVLVLPQDKELSRRHAIIVQESGRFMIQDQNSLNGTYVNDELISGPRYLEDGDAILIGLSTFKFEQE